MSGSGADKSGRQPAQWTVHRSPGAQQHPAAGGGGAVQGAGALLPAVHRHQRHQGSPGGAAGALTHPAVHQENVYLRRHGGSEAGAGLF